MLDSIEKLLEKGFGNRIIKHSDLTYVFKGTDASRYGIINKALKSKQLVQLCRGIYIIAKKYRSQKFCEFYVANQIIPSSFISCETALSFHDWIPERVYLNRSVILKGRTRSFDTPLGEFEYIKIPVNQYKFLSCVSREEYDDQAFLMATPLRALADYVYIHKIEWIGIDFLLDSLRIESDNLELLRLKDFQAILCIYKSKRVLNFLEKLKESLGLLG